MRIKRRIVGRTLMCVTLTAVLVALFGVAAQAQSGPVEVWVDDDFGSTTSGWGVDHFDSIQDGVDAVAAGGTVHVAAGTYAEDVIVDESMTVGGMHPPEGTEAATVDGMVTINADSVTLESLHIAPTAVYLTDIGAGAGILVSGGNDVLVQNNVVEGVTGDATGGSFSVHGIQIWTCDGYSGIVVRNNQIKDIHNQGGSSWPSYGGAVGIKVQGHVSDVDILGNEIDAVHSAGWGYGVSYTYSGSCSSEYPHNVTVENNDISNVNNGSEYDVADDPSAAPYPGTCVVVDDDQDFASNFAEQLTVRYNRLSNGPDGSGIVNKDNDGELNATCNWWDDLSGPTHAANPGGTGEVFSGDVDFAPWLIYSIDGDGTTHGFQLPEALSVTPTPGGSENAADNDFRRLANALECVADDQTVDISGEFDWTETNASDVYSDSARSAYAARGLRLPHDVDNVTITSSAKDAHIIGVGEMLDASLMVEAFLYADSGNADVIVENLQIDDFEMPIGLGWSVGSGFDGTTVQNNELVVSGDSGDATEWAQNIAVSLGRGQNQSVLSNTVTFEADGTRTEGYFGSASGNSIGFQSNTHPGDGYDGLVIAGNTFQMGPASNDQEKVLGVWDNHYGDGEEDDLTIINNEFLGRAGDDFDRALRLSTDQAQVEGNTFSDVDQVLYNRVYGGNPDATFNFDSNTLARVGGGDGVFLTTYMTDTTTVEENYVNWNVNNTIDGETGVRGLNELSTQATHGARPSSAANKIDNVTAIGEAEADLYVDDDWGTAGRFTDPDGIGIGAGPIALSYNTYTTIQEALDAAGTGDTIAVFPGTYEEDLELSVESLTLEAVGDAADTTIKGDTVRITADDVTVDGFTIDNENGDRAIGPTDSDGTILKNNLIVNSYRGIQGDWYGRPTNLTITGNTFTTTYGVAGTEDVTDLLVQGNTFATSAEGIGLGEGVVVTGIDNNHFSGEGEHVRDYRSPSDPALLEEILADNTFERAAVVRGSGIKVPAIFSSIQDAVDAAEDGDTVSVMNGTYEEQVVIAKDVTVVGDSPAVVVKAPTAVPTCFTTSDEKKPVVCVKDGADATIDTLTVDGAGRGNANHEFIGVAFYNADGALQNSIVKDIRETPLSGSQHGVGVYAYTDDGSPRSVSVIGNEIFGFQKNGMALNSGSGALTVHVESNTVTGAGVLTFDNGDPAQNGIQVYEAGAGLLDGSIENNTVSGIAYDNTNNPTKYVASSVLNYFADADITGNTVSDGHVGIYSIGGENEISENVLEIEKVGVSAHGILATDPPTAVPSPYDEQEAGTAEAKGLRAVQAPEGSTLDVVLSKNTIELSGSDNTDTYGIEAYAGYLTADDLSFTAVSNTVTGFDLGVGIYQLSSTSGVFTGVTVNGNSIAGNDTGLYSNVDYLTVEAEGDWWGSSDPEMVAGVISGSVDYTPWLASGTDTESTVPGFQGDFSELWVDDDSPQIGSSGRIQEGIDLVAGSTISVAAGTYAGKVTVDKSVTLVGAGDGDAPVSSTVIDEGTARSGTGLSVQADTVTIQDLRVKSFNTGVNIGNISDLDLTGVSIVDNRNGVRVSSQSNVDGLHIGDAHIDANDIGIYLSKDWDNESDTSTVTDVEIVDTSFIGNLKKGLYAEKLEKAVFDNVTVSNSGHSSTYNFNNGIDINLKNGDYEDITIKNSRFEGSGRFTALHNGMDFSGALVIKARDDGNYGDPVAATLTDVEVLSNTFRSPSGNHTVALRFGEPGAGNAGPTDVEVHFNTFDGGFYSWGLWNTTSSLVDAGHNYWGAASGPAGEGPGSGDKVSALVDYCPYYADEDLSSLAHCVPTAVTLTPASATRYRGDTVNYTVEATDPFADLWDATDVASFSIEPGAGGSWVDNVYTCEAVGVWTTTATVEGVTDSAVLTVANTAPVAVDDVATTDEDNDVDIPVLSNDSDVDEDALSIAAFVQPSDGTVTENEAGTLNYDPDPDICGTDAFTYTVSDGNGGSDTAAVTVTVTCVNDAPVATDDEAATQQDTPVAIDVTANDSDPEGELDLSTVVTTAGPANGSVTVAATGVVTYTPDTGYVGEDSFTYTVEDADGATSNEATVTVLVSSAAPPEEEHTLYLPVLRSDQ